MELFESFDLLSGFLVVLAFGLGLVLLRLVRVRRCRSALVAPASQLLTKNPKWRAQLPSGVQLDSKAPLFEVLYMSFRLKPGQFAPGSVSHALSGPRPPAGPPTLGSSVERLSAEEKVQSLLTAQNLPQAEGAPVESLTQNIVVNLVSVLTGKKKLKAGVEHAVLDSLGAGGGFAGAKLGGVLGVALLPLLAGIATAVLPILMILGAWVGSIVGKKVSSRMKSRHRYAALKNLRRVSLNLKKSFLLRIPELRLSLDQEYQRKIAFTRDLRRKRQGLIARAFYPDLMAVFLEMSVHRIQRDWDVDRKQWNQIRRKVKMMPPLEVGDVLKRLTDAGSLAHPELLARYKEYEAALEELKKVDQIAA